MYALYWSLRCLILRVIPLDHELVFVEAAIDRARFRKDVDAVIDQDVTPRA